MREEGEVGEGEMRATGSIYHQTFSGLTFTRDLHVDDFSWLCGKRTMPFTG